MIFMTTFALTVCASRTFRIPFDTLSKCYRSKNSFFTMFRASWIPFVPSTSRITDICPNSIPSMFGCHIICLPYVGYFFRQLSSIIQCWRWLKQRRKLKFYGCLILSYRKQNSKCLIFVMLNLTIFEHLGN